MWTPPFPGVVGPPSARLRVLYPQRRGSRGVGVLACGVREWMAPGFVDRPRGTDDWLLVQFRHAVTIDAGLGRVEAPALSLVIWRPHAPHFLGNGQEPWCHSWIHLDGAEMQDLVSASGLPVDQPIALGSHQWLDRCVLAVHEEASGESPDGEILRSQLEVFLRQARRGRAERGGKHVPRELLALRDHLELTYANSHALPGLARRCGCSVPHLCARFRAAFGTSPIAYLIGVRLRHARLLLGDRNRGVAEVARLVGYDDYHHFSKLFHRRFGHWPSQQRGRP